MVSPQSLVLRFDLNEDTIPAHVPQERDDGVRQAVHVGSVECHHPVPIGEDDLHLMGVVGPERLDLGHRSSHALGDVESLAALLDLDPVTNSEGAHASYYGSSLRKMNHKSVLLCLKSTFWPHPEKRGLRIWPKKWDHDLDVKITLGG